MGYIIDFLKSFDPTIQALFATGFTWAVTALGAATVFMAKQVNRKLLDGMLGFAGGVMIAASFWSLLAPAIEMSRQRNSSLVSGCGRFYHGRYLFKDCR